jgi:hypothetical protein
MGVAAHAQELHRNGSLPRFVRGLVQPSRLVERGGWSDRGEFKLPAERQPAAIGAPGAILQAGCPVTRYDPWRSESKLIRLETPSYAIDSITHEGLSIGSRREFFVKKGRSTKNDRP